MAVTVQTSATLKITDAATHRCVACANTRGKAVQEELTRSAAVLARRAESARKAGANAIERTARLKAWKAFAHSGGTRASFERWWPQVFGSANTARLSADD